MALDKLPDLPPDLVAQTEAPKPKKTLRERWAQVKGSKLGRATAAAKNATVAFAVVAGTKVREKAGPRLGALKERVVEGASNAAKAVRAKLSSRRESSPGLVETLDGSSTPDSPGDENMALQKFNPGSKPAPEGGKVMQLPVANADGDAPEVATPEPDQTADAPEVPAAAAVEIDMPKIEAPKVEAPALDIPAVSPPQTTPADKPDFSTGMLAKIAAAQAEVTQVSSALKVAQSDIEALKGSATKDEITALSARITAAEGRLDSLQDKVGGIVVPTAKEITENVWGQIKPYMDGLVESLNGELAKFGETIQTLQTGHSQNAGSIQQLAGHMSQMTQAINAVSQATDSHADSLKQIQEALF